MKSRGQLIKEQRDLRSEVSSTSCLELNHHKEYEAEGIMLDSPC